MLIASYPAKCRNPLSTYAVKSAAPVAALVAPLLRQAPQTAPLCPSNVPIQSPVSPWRSIGLPSGYINMRIYKACVFLTLLLFKLPRTFRSCYEVESVLRDVTVMKVNHRPRVTRARERRLSGHYQMPSRTQCVFVFRISRIYIMYIYDTCTSTPAYYALHVVVHKEKIARAQRVEKNI